MAEQPQELLRGRPLAASLFGVEGQLLGPLPRRPQLPLDQRLDEQTEEVEGEERLDPALVLEEDRGDLVDGLGLLEALLDRRLALMGFEHLGAYFGST